MASCQWSVAAQVAGMRVLLAAIRTALKLFLFLRMNTEGGVYGRLPKRRSCNRRLLLPPFRSRRSPKRRQPAELASQLQAAPAVYKRLRRFKYQAPLDCGALASAGYKGRCGKRPYIEHPFLKLAKLLRTAALWQAPVQGPAKPAYLIYTIFLVMACFPWRACRK